MATRSRTSFQKRQKEIARAEKQRDKAAKRVLRKQAHAEGRPFEEDDDLMSAEEAAGDPPREEQGREGPAAAGSAAEPHK